MKMTSVLDLAFRVAALIVAAATMTVVSATDAAAQFGGPRQASLSPIPVEFIGSWQWDMPRQNCGTLLDSFGRPAVFGPGTEAAFKEFNGGSSYLCAWPFGELEKVMNGRGRLWWKTFSADDAISPKFACIVSWGRANTGGTRLITQRADAMVMVFNAGQRYIYTDGRKHPPATEQLYWGHSIGWMEGETFVVETTNFTWDPDAYDDQAHFARTHLAKWVERYTLKDKDTMELQFIVEDPVFLRDTFKWTAKLKKATGAINFTYECDPETEGQAIYSTFKNPYPDDNTLERFFGAGKQ